MRVLLLNQFYYPDIAATAQLAADLGEDLVRRGHQVTAIASTRAYSGEGAPLPRRGEHRGVRIVRVPTTDVGRRSLLGRAVDYASFLAGALAPLFAEVRPDVVVALSTPPLVAALGLLVRELRRARLVYWVMDVYPDLAVRLGALRSNGAAARALELVGRTLYHRADAIVALDEAMRDRLVAAGGSPAKIEVIDNWCDGAAIRPAPAAANALRRELGLGDMFTVSYSGHMGLGHDFDTVLGAMERLREEPVHWLFIGDGPRRASFEAQVRARALGHVSFLSSRAREELPVSLTAADASLVSLEAGMGGLIVPSKLYGILAAGVPVLYVGPREGRVAGVVRDDQVGLASANRDPAGLARAILRLRDDAVERAAMGRRARQLFEDRFDRPLALERHHRLLCRVGGAPC